MSKSSQCGRDQLPGTQDVPLVSVIIGTYNGEKYLDLAIESLLNQTFRDFELIVIDDCSTDDTLKVLEEIKDGRMRVIRNHRNLGIPGTLNKAIDLAIGKYIAFMDHDDVSLPDRLHLQSQFLDGHPEVAMVGSSCRFIDDSGNVVKDVQAKCDDATLRWRLLWYNPFIQTTLMVRRSVLAEIGGYSCDPMYKFSEDFEMMSRLALRYAVANLPQSLACWRRHAASTSASVSIGNRLHESGANISLRNVLEVWQRSGERVPPDKAAYLYEGMWSFQFPARPGRAQASPRQILCAPEYLKRLECTFSNTTPGLQQTPSMRAARYWQWSKRATALVVRQRWGLRLRVALLVDALKLLFYAGWCLAKKRT